MPLIEECLQVLQQYRQVAALGFCVLAVAPVAEKFPPFGIQEPSRLSAGAGYVLDDHLVGQN